MSKKTLDPFIELPLKLFIIATLTVLALALVNSLTSGRIAENKAAKTQEALAFLFPDGTAAPMSYDLTAEEASSVTDIYSITADGRIYGYAVALKAAGFGGDIEMIVGVGSDESIVGVRVVGSSETPSIGATAISDGVLLSRFNSRSLLSPEVDGISGATITSRAVNSGVKTAAELVLRILKNNG